MATTYSTSAECALSAGLNDMGTTSRPRTTQVDELRNDAYALIVFELGSAATDSNGILKKIEKDLVRKGIFAIQKDLEYMMELSENQMQIISEFKRNIESWSLTWEPGENT